MTFPSTRLQLSAVSHIREIGDDGDACRYEQMNTHLKNPVGAGRDMHIHREMSHLLQR